MKLKEYYNYVKAFIFKIRDSSMNQDKDLNVEVRRRKQKKEKPLFKGML